MSDEALTGWDVWVEASGKYRHMSVADPDRAIAEKIAADRMPNGTVTYSHELPNQVMRFLKAKRGDVFEWVSTDKSRPLEPLLPQAKKK